MATETTRSFAAQAFRLQTRGVYRCHNLILHPNGQMYGDGLGLACAAWFLQEERIHFVDHSGRVRFIFERGENACWHYTAPPRPPGPPRKVRFTLQLEGRGALQVAAPSADYQLLPQGLPPGKRQFEIVVAKYTEDIAWLDAFSANATVYSKCAADQGTFTCLANWGREGGTYLHHIVTHYDDLAARTLFLQADPFPHPLLAFIDYAADTSPFTCARCEDSSIDHEIPWSAPAQRIDRPAMVDFLKLIECARTIGAFRWVQGAQFAVARDQIRTRPRDYYRRMLELTQREQVTLAGRSFDNHHVAWLFELFWRYVFWDVGPTAGHAS